MGEEYKPKEKVLFFEQTTVIEIFLTRGEKGEKREDLDEFTKC